MTRRGVAQRATFVGFATASVAALTSVGVVNAATPQTAPIEAATVNTVVSQFSDVDGTDQFSKEINWLASEGVSTGWTVGNTRQYRPLDSISREAMAAFLYRIAGKPNYNPPSTSPFRDVRTSDQFYKEITWLASEKITTGWDVSGGKEFRPGAQIDRDAMAAFLYRMKGQPSFQAPTTSPFTDVSPNRPFYKEITWLSGEGITTGWSTSSGRQFRPGGVTGKVKRDAMAAFLFRFAQTSLATPDYCR